MNPLIYFRREQRRFARLAILFCATVWLNMAVQPCLMALELAPNGDAHHSDCPHCPEQHCDDHAGGGRCAFIGALDYDGRTPPPPQADFHDSFAIVVPPSGAALGANGPPVWRPAPQSIPPPRRHLYLQHCVLLI